MRCFALICMLLLVACSSEPPPSLPTMTPAPKPAVVALPTLLDSPQIWIGRPLVLIAPAQLVNGVPLLVSGFHYDGTRLRPLSTSQSTVWVAGTLPSDVNAQFIDGLGYLKLRGQLGPPGGYGPGARYPYQFTLNGSGVLEPASTTLVNLATNAHALNDVLLKVEGTLLATKAGALLTEQTGSGGVPRNDAHQIKLHGLPDPQVVQQLASSGDVHYGPVTVVGWWHNGSLVAFVIQPAS